MTTTAPSSTTRTSPSAPLDRTMKAVVQEGYGSADVLELGTAAQPVVGDSEVLIRVRAAGVDRGVWHLMTGLPYFLRLIIPTLGLRGPKNPVPGSDVAGVVSAVGEAVTRFRPGDEVYGVGRGTYAEYAAAPEDKLALKPVNLSFEEAAAVPISGLTALQAVRDSGGLQRGQKVLIIGASGGVGTFAVQIANSSGADVTGVCSTGKAELVMSLGADRVIDYTRDDFVDGTRYDLIIDTGGHSSLPRLRRALTRTGTVVIVGAETDDRWTGGFGRSIRASLLSRFVAQRLIAFVNSENHKDLITLKDMIEAGELSPVMDRTFPLGEVSKAIRYLEEGHARGKVVITVEGGAI